ncbi:MAG: RNA 2'-phosphotransferase [Planctomycetes bacterium]|nr:RNA 2'-phosphotransferase [Planctomycetota bacterium]
MPRDRKTKVSKTMAYLLRHDPEGMEMDGEGFVWLNDLIEKLEARGFKVDEGYVKDVVQTDSKGRYELSGNKIRAVYGHSIDVEPSLSADDCPDVLYHGTTEKAARRILAEGLKPRGRQKVHLSSTVEGACDVGRRHCAEPVILRIDCEAAAERGVEIQQASSEIYVAREIPAEAVERHSLT